MIYAPAENANPDKLEAMRWLGADVRQHGRDFDDAREQVERVAKEERLRYVHSANEPLLIAGVGTIGLEIIETAPDTGGSWGSEFGGGLVAAGSAGGEDGGWRIKWRKFAVEEIGGSACGGLP